MERIMEFSPAYDRGTKHEVHGVDLWMVLKGPEGAVQFVLHTNWQLPHVTRRMLCEFLEKGATHGPYCFLPQPCGGALCVRFGHTIGATARVFEVLLKEGSDGVWRELEKFYKETFG
jgi:hypothetical protein